jgi:3-oxoadipate enol-lactonase
MPNAAVNGTEISYADTGGDGPVVVLSHGILMDQSMFAPQVQALAPEFRVIVWDQRGHGGTPARGPFSYWDSARDLLGLLDHVGVQRAVLGGRQRRCGHPARQGGGTARRAARTRAARRR